MVKVAYRGYFDDGATFIDQTRQPIEFPCADGWMPPAFVDAVRDMAVGETKRVRVGADEAYEKRTEERVIEVERAKIPADIKLAVGDVMSLERPDGQTYPARLVELDEERAVFDLNHDVIAKALNFEITLLDVRDQMCIRDRSRACGGAWPRRTLRGSRRRSRNECAPRPSCPRP